MSAVRLSPSIVAQWAFSQPDKPSVPRYANPAANKHAARCPFQFPPDKQKWIFPPHIAESHLKPAETALAATDNLVPELPDGCVSHKNHRLVFHLPQQQLDIVPYSDNANAVFPRQSAKILDAAFQSDEMHPAPVFLSTAILLHRKYAGKYIHRMPDRGNLIQSDNLPVFPFLR